jgi:Cupin domain/Carboxypeptidase regulatory-like domain
MRSALVAGLALVLVVDIGAQSRGRGSGSSKPGLTTPVRVTVRDPAGNSLSDARLALSGDTSGDFVTGGAGTAILPDLKDGSYRVRVEHREFVTLEREFVVRGGMPKAIDITLTPEPPAPPPPPPAPAPAPTKALPPPGPPVTMSIVDFIDKNFIGKEPFTESVLACASAETVRLLQIREALASHTHADADEILYVVAGEGTAHLDTQTVALKPGMLVLAPRASAHSLERKGRNPLMLLSTLAGAACHEATASR